MNKIDFQKLIDERQPKDIDELNRILEEESLRINRTPLAEFSGLSSNQMYPLLNDPFGEGSPFGFKDFNPAVLDQSPFFLLAEDMLRRTVLNASPFKMTASTLSLPVKVVKELYERLTLKDEYIESGINKLYKESDCPIIHVCKIVLDNTCIVRKQHGKWLLTKKGEKLVQPAQRAALFQEIFKTFTLTYNWAYLDGFDHPFAGQMGFAYSLSLLSNFGDPVRTSDFYAQKYDKAFPMLVKQFPPSSWSTPKRNLARCFSLRFVDHFVYWWGLVDVTQKEEFFPNKPSEFKKADLLDLVFRVPVMKVGNG